MVHEGKLESPVAEDIERKYEQFRQEFTVVYRKTLTLSRELASELSYLEQEAASVLVDGVTKSSRKNIPATVVAEYLEEVRHHLLDNLDPFKEREGRRRARRRGAGRVAQAPGWSGARSLSRIRRERDSCTRQRRQIACHFRDHAYVRQLVRNHPARL